METIQKIRNLVSDTFTVEISSFVDVFQDDYLEGELDHVNHWSNEKMLWHVEPENLREELLVNLEEYFEKEVLVDFDLDSLKDELRTYADDEFLWTNKFVNVDNCEPTEEEIAAWKRNELMLYVQNINIRITVNGKSLTSALIYELLFEEELA